MHKCFDTAFDKTQHEDPLIRIERTHYLLKDKQARFEYVEKYLLTYGEPKLHLWSREQSNEIQYFIVNCKSDLLDRLLKGSSKTNWVDIEGIFYGEMIAILNSNKSLEAKEHALQGLNASMRHVIQELEIYLSGLKTPQKIDAYSNIIYSRIDAKDIQSKPIGSRTDRKHPFATSIPNETLILNFNYTDTIYNYSSKHSYKSPTISFIHGKLSDRNNPVIFGFGDEVDRRYEEIENSPVRGWFDYIKSFWYLKTNNYRDLTSFIDSDEYQALVLGHSCGLSDRTMLQMIFQHDNCCSIKLFYHGNKDLNNHRQTLHEVARHFKDKGLMRRRIVSEENSERMPQFND